MFISLTTPHGLAYRVRHKRIVTLLGGPSTVLKLDDGTHIEVAETPSQIEALIAAAGAAVTSPWREDIQALARAALDYLGSDTMPGPMETIALKEIARRWAPSLSALPAVPVTEICLEDRGRVGNDYLSAMTLAGETRALFNYFAHDDKPHLADRRLVNDTEAARHYWRLRGPIQLTSAPAYVPAPCPPPPTSG